MSDTRDRRDRYRIEWPGAYAGSKLCGALWLCGAHLEARRHDGVVVDTFTGEDVTSQAHEAWRLFNQQMEAKHDAQTP